MNKPLFSIIVPCFRVEEFLPACLDSILQQDFGDYEAIIVDDGSPDKSGEIADGYALRDVRFRVIHQSNQGVSAARNAALGSAAGQWIWFVDGDDYIAEGALRVLSDLISEEQCDTLFFGYNNLYGDNIVPTPIIEMRNEPKAKVLESILCYYNPSMIFSNDVIRKFQLRFPEGIRMAEDLEFQYKYLMHCELPVGVNFFLCYYRHRENSATTNPNTHRNNMSDCLKVANNLLRYIEQLGFSEETWLSLRIRILLKSGLQSSEHLTAPDRKNQRHALRATLREFKRIGFSHIADKTLKLACFNFNLYIFALRCYYKIKGIRP